jgi:murein DD-endopeptidase MepM/ murein hydrolase activator NlpD
MFQLFGCLHKCFFQNSCCLHQVVLNKFNCLNSRRFLIQISNVYLYTFIPRRTLLCLLCYNLEMNPWLHLICLPIILIFVACNNSTLAPGDHQSPPDKVSLEIVLEENSILEEFTPTSLPLVDQIEAPLPVRTVAESIDASLTLTPTAQFDLCSPLELHEIEDLSAIISSPYNPPPPGKDERHHGVDFGYWDYAGRKTMQGELVQSILPGVVAMILNDHFPYGNTVMVETPASLLPNYLVSVLGFEPGDSLYVLYAHLDAPPLVSLGESVEACHLLGEVGLSGNTDVAHLHLETRLGPAGAIFESMMFYSTRATIEEMENYKLWRTSGVFRHFDPMRLLLSISP